jgi:hypothetical protein
MTNHHQPGAAQPLTPDSESDGLTIRPSERLWRQVETVPGLGPDLTLQAEADALFIASGGDLPPDELDFLARYRALGTVPRLAIRRYLTADDDRLVVAIYLQRFLGVRPR